MASPFPLRPVWVLVPFLGSVFVAAVFAVDLSTAVDGASRAALRVAVIAAAAVVAGTFYQRWSTVPTRAVPHHVMAALALLGGALVASSAFGAGGGVFSSDLTAALGIAAMATSLLAARATLTTSTGVRR